MRILKMSEARRQIYGIGILSWRIQASQRVAQGTGGEQIHIGDISGPSGVESTLLEQILGLRLWNFMS